MGWRERRDAEIGGRALLLNVEPMTGIEHAYSAWEVGLRRFAENASIRKVPQAARTGPSAFEQVLVDSAGL